MTETFGRTHVLIGNGDCRPLTFGTKDDVRAEVKRCIDLGRDCPGYSMCISGHIPANVPVQNALNYDDVYCELGRR
jgi:uroporphyrinogen-III decarboxylase